MKYLFKVGWQIIINLNARVGDVNREVLSKDENMLCCCIH